MVQLLREWVDLDNQPLAMTTPHRSTRQGFAHNSGHYLGGDAFGRTFP